MTSFKNISFENNMLKIDLNSNFKKYIWQQRWLKVKTNTFNFFKTTQFKLLMFYLILIFLGAGLLMLPISVNTYDMTNQIGQLHKKWNFMSALFVCCSGFSDTGLTVTAIKLQLTTFGQVVLLSLIQIGGLGFVALKIIIFTLIFKKFTLKDKVFVNFEKGSVRFGDSLPLIKIAIFVIFFCEIVFGIVLMFHFHYSNLVYNNLLLQAQDVAGSTGGDYNGILANLANDLHNNWGTDLWYGIFHSTSAINNAGFDLFGGNSLYYFWNDYLMQTIFIILIIIGGIGFPVFYEIKNYFVAKRYKQQFQFSLFTKITVIWYFLVLFVVFVFMVIFENATPASLNQHYFDPTSGQNWNYLIHDNTYTTGQKYWIMFFTSVSTRNAGFSTYEMQGFTDPSKLAIAISMWIGASACSTGGGIRVTTFAVIFMTVLAFIRRKNNVTMRKRKISSFNTLKAMAVAMVSLVLIFVASTIIFSTTYEMIVPDGSVEKPINYVFYTLDIFVETTSAFGTTGLSTGLTPWLNEASLLALIALMFIGQLTITGTLALFRTSSKSNKIEKISYKEEEIILG